MMKGKGKKIGIGIIGSVILFLIPYLIIIAVVATPVKAIADFFSSIFKNDGVDTQLINMMQEYIYSEEGQKEVWMVYDPFIQSIKQETNIDVPLYYVVIPNLLSGISPIEKKGGQPSAFDDVLNEMRNELLIKVVKSETDEQGNKKEKISYQLADLDVYLTRLKNTPRWNKLSEASTEKLVNYLNATKDFEFKKTNHSFVTENQNFNFVNSNYAFPAYKAGLKTLPGNVFGNELMAQCTWYVANRYLEFGINIGGWGNGGDWWWQAQNRGYTISKTPHVGWAVSMPPRSTGTVQVGYYAFAGHIAFVEAVGDGYIVVSEMSAGDYNSYQVRSIPARIYQEYWFIDFGLGS